MTLPNEIVFVSSRTAHFSVAHHSILNWIMLEETLFRDLQDQREDKSSREDDDMSRGG